MPREDKASGGEVMRPTDSIREEYESLRLSMLKYGMATVMGGIVTAAAAFQEIITNSPNNTERLIAGVGAATTFICAVATSFSHDKVSKFRNDYAEELARTERSVQIPPEADILLEYFNTTRQVAPKEPKLN